MANKLIYHFSKNKCEGSASMKHLLGSKGAHLAEMCNLGIPVPPGFTISCMSNWQEALSRNIYNEIKNSILTLEDEMECQFGDESNPLLVSIRSGSIHSMPGMMDTVLNVGLNDQTVIGMARTHGERFAYDSYCRFINMYANVVLNLDNHLFQNIIDHEQQKSRVQNLSDLDIYILKKIIREFKKIIYISTKIHFPQNVLDQLFNSINAVFKSWNNNRAIAYRKIHSIPDTLGTAVNIQAMVFGNLNDQSATGVIFTRNPSNGENRLFGEFLMNAQGSDIVSGIYTPMPILGHQSNCMAQLMPMIYQELCLICHSLEAHYKDMQDIEFTVQDSKLWILQTRSGKRSTEAAIRIIVDMVNEKIITKEEGIAKVDIKAFVSLLHPVLDVQKAQRVIGMGLPASPGVASGYALFNINDVEQAILQDQKIILVRSETSTEDINSMHTASGIITTRGGMTSHAAVVTRGMGKPCICSVSDMYIDQNGDFCFIGNTKVNKGDPITINGGTGEVMLGLLPTILPTVSQEFNTIINWTDEIKKIEVKANADTPQEIHTAKAFGAEGIGLCRTEHMFFAHDRIDLIQKLIIADSAHERCSILSQLEKIQKSDFKEIFSIMKNQRVTIRLLDPPLHEFLPNNQSSIERIARSLNKSVESIKSKIIQLSEKNPMLGHRGCRLAVSYPEIYSMQIRAIFSAAEEIIEITKLSIVPEIMVPFVMNEKELILICQMIKQEAKNFDIQYIIGTMIELPRAALIADKLAKHVEFFSFGTNDLTQTTLGLSRDDACHFIDLYKKRNVLEHDPFEVLDIEGVGELIKIAIYKGRENNINMKFGICGEHGADPKSIEFFSHLGIDYISCSPYRLPIAKLVLAKLNTQQRDINSFY
ncbi:pyruvate, phosphate dikinase [Wolbachia endosymbiont of Howardula sp.]|uniref:pyruvate, phosphate dikinase n=1 Tax=Wolbachia endosymbiont of Howardula sp. TaxID=2916816 RepID=UPI00217EA19E|nr:pyruvate, phosphate dikinase [Wolbachia endosymbiont of Howardula sp.]UWI83375.1 pyruvate, phosphate dikinase [Wolbachia endosymbiont of Howardula sp.]